MTSKYKITKEEDSNLVRETLQCLTLAGNMLLTNHVEDLRSTAKWLKSLVEHRALHNESILDVFKEYSLIAYEEGSGSYSDEQLIEAGYTNAYKIASILETVAIWKQLQ